jgi:HK97 family phage major capsid protein
MEIRELKHRRAVAVAAARALFDLRERREDGRLTRQEAEQLEARLTEAERLTDEIGKLEPTLAPWRQNGHALPHMEPRNKNRYSLLRAIRTVAEDKVLGGLEGEISTELQRCRREWGGRGAPARGFTMPLDLPVDLGAAARGRRLHHQEARAFDTTAGTGGIPTILETTWIGILRTRMATVQAGALVLEDMRGNFAIPRQSSAATITWCAEGGAPAPSNQTVDQVPFTPHTVSAWTDISRRLSEQLNNDAEQFVREDLAAVVARGVDAASLMGTGTSNQPLGIVNQPGVIVEAIGANGGPPSFPLVVALETDVAKQNADEGSLAYMTNASVRGKLKTTTKIASPSFPVMVWGEDPEPLNGYPAFVTNQLPSNLIKGGSGPVCSPLIFGNFADLVYVIWGAGQDVIIDPYSLSTQGAIRVVTLMDADVNIRHPQSFAMCLDCTTT